MQSYLPVADIGDCSLGVTVNVIGVQDVPPDNSIVISTYPTDSNTVYSFREKLTLMTMYKIQHKVTSVHEQ